ncbi:MAG: alpha-galactosidase [Candidatus Helarchaeota archaeon]
MLDFKQEKKKLILENKFLKLEFDSDSGFFDLFNKETEKYIISNAYSSISYNSINTDTLGFSKLKWDVKNFENNLGKGISLILKFLSKSKLPEFNLIFEIYEEKPFIFIRNEIINNSEHRIRIKSLNPMVISETHYSKLKLGSSINDWRILAGAYQSWAPVKLVKPFDKNFIPKSPESLYPGKIILLSNPKEKREKYEQVGDNYIIIKNVRTQNNVLFGFLTFKNQFCQILFQFDKKKNSIRKVLARCQADNVVLEPKKKLSSELLMINFNSPPIENLILYSDLVQKINDVKLWHEVPTGYCTWYIYFQKINEKECLKNIKFMANRRNEIPIKYFQLDDGYEVDIGDWETNEKFPNGMKRFVEEIEKAGFVPGLWIAPFIVGKKSKLYKEHPDWVLRDDNNKPLFVLRNPAWGFFNKIFALDCSHPEVQEWLRSLFTKITQDWGFKCIKIDFIYAACAGTRFYDESMTRAQVYRKGLEIIRETIGPDVLLLGCGAPIGPSIGFVNAMRVSTDTHFVFLPFLSKFAKKILNVHNIPCVYNAMMNNIRSFFMHKRWWINDPDCLMVRLKKTKLTEDEVRTEITCIGLLNGYYFLSDDFDYVDEKQVSLVRKFFPYNGKSAIPLDLFESEIPEILIYPVKSKFEEYQVIGFFNWSNKTQNKFFELEQLGLDETKEYHVFDFWEQKYYGKFRDGIRFDDFRKHSCKLVTIKEAKTVPQLLSTNLHFTQGELEVKLVDYDRETKKLYISLEFPGKHRESLFFHNPEESKWSIDEKENCELIQISKNLYELKIEYEDDFKTFIHC